MVYGIEPKGCYMKYLFILLSLFVLTANAQGRKPAVEDFVGVEPTENYEEAVTAKETQYFYNFGKKISDQARTPATSTGLEKGNFWEKWSALAGFVLFVSLPFALWGFIHAMTPKISTNTSTSEEASKNITHLDDYRDNQKDSPDQKKAG